MSGVRFRRRLFFGFFIFDFVEDMIVAIRGLGPKCGTLRSRTGCVGSLARSYTSGRPGV
jgi:hypothetical protein